MEPEERVLDLSGREIAGGPAESYGVQSMLGMLSEIQTLVERSNIINRSPHIDLNWYLQFSSDEPEIRLARTVRRVLACRYQPAQLDLIAMAGQVREAEEFQCCVQDQVGAMKSMMATRVCDPDSLKRVEGQWGDALLDASATVHVKATQLGQVKDYHKKMKVIRAFLQVLQGEKDKMNLNSLGSSALQADGLQALLQTMEGKKGMLEELLCLGSQLSVHLSDSESSGALLAQLGDVQEEWRHLVGSIKRAFWHASNTVCQHSLLINNIGELKAKLEALQKLRFRGHDTFGYLCLRAELKLYNLLCLRFQAQLDSLTLISLGQKEKDETIHNLLDLKSLISVTKSKLDTSTYNCYGTLTAKANKQIQEWIEWAKQAENHIAVGPQLALFPEEACVQIAEMKKFQTDFSSKRLKLRVESEQMKDVFMEKAEILQLWQATVGLYETVDKNLEGILDTMKKNLEDREKLFFQLANMDAWLVEIVGKKDPYTHVDSISKADLGKLESELKSIKSSTVDLENHMKQLEAVMDSCREISPDLSPGESHYLVNRLSGLWAVLDGLVAHEKASCWELEELIFKRRSSEEELSNIQMSLQQISVALQQERFPLSHETILTLEHLMHTLIEHQWEVQELQHCQETKRSSLLCTIGELQDKCKALSVNAYEQDKYLHLRKQMEESISIAREQTQCVKATTVSVGERFRLCQTLLVELPLVKTQCQEAADQLEAIAQDLSPSELHSERQRIIQNVETLGSWEHSITDDIKYLENKILLGLDFSSEFPLFIEHLQKIRAELGGVEPVKPDEKVIDIKLQRCWVIWRNLECGVRVLEGLGQKEKIEKKNSKDLYALKSAAKHECQLRMESLSRARESLKDYHWAAQGAISFLHNAEATFLTAPGGFSDCTEEQKQTQQALEALEAGFQAHISHLSGLLPQQSCLSRPDTEELHISILSQLTVGRAIMEAQAQIRLESLQRCKMRQRGHKKCHEALGQLLSGLQTKLSEWAAEKTTSFEKCVGQQEAAKLLMEDLRSVSTQIEELRAGCPMQGCGVGKGGELGALWRRWLCLRRGIGLLTAHAQQRANEWRDITASIKESRRCLNTLQADVLDASTVSFTMVDPQELLGRAEMHQAALQVQQQALASLQHRMEQVLISSTSQEPLSPGPVGKTLVMSRESVVSLKERNLLVLAAAQAEVRERQEVKDEIGEVEQQVAAVLSSLGHQEFREELSSQRAKLERIRERAQIRYPVIPADICRRLDEAHLSIQKEEERLTGKKNPVWKLDTQVAELESSLETVKVLLEQQSPTVDEAQHLLKHVWDKLDAWHSRLMLLENEVEDLAEDHPDQAHILVDQLTRPLQLYQNAAQMAEQRTAFLGKIPACLQEFDGILYSATCWLEEAQSWLYAPCSFTTAKNLQNHANSLQLVLDDSERIRLVMQDFRAVLDDICSVCNMSWQKDRLQQSDQQVHKMQRTILEQLELFVQAVQEVEAMEEEVKTLDNNVAKIQAILSSVDNSSLSLREQQVILTNMASIRRTLEEVESCKGELHLPQGAEESLLIFSRAQQLLQTVQELEQLTEQQSMQLQSQEPEPIVMSDPDEENKSCHSSSSDTLTCSIPEDLEEKQSEDNEELLRRSDHMILDGGELIPEMETSVNVSAGVSNAETVETASVTVVPEDDGGNKESLHECRPAECQITAGTPDLTFSGVQIPLLEGAGRPFSAAEASGAVREKGQVHLSPTVDLRKDQVIENVDVPQKDDRDDQNVSVDTSQQGQGNGCEGGDLSWRQLFMQISQKMASLGQVKEERQSIGSEGGESVQDVSRRMLMSPRSTCEALWRTQESVAMLRQIRGADSLHPDLNEEMFRAVRSVLLCLTELTDSGLKPSDARNDGSQLRLLQQECLSTEVLKLSELMAAVRSEILPRISREHPEAERCLRSLQDCLDMVPLSCTPLCCQLSQQLDLPCQHQELNNLLNICDVFDLKPCWTFPHLMDSPIMELILGRRVQEGPGEKAGLLQASRSLLRGISGLLEQGEGCLTEGLSQVHSRARAEAALRRQQKLLHVLDSQVAFVQNLFQREPKALVSLGAEWTQLEVRARCLQQRILDQEVVSQQRIQDWARWEGLYGRLSAGGMEGDDQKPTELRLDACQLTLKEPGDSEAAAGLLLDQLSGLQGEPVGPVGGALEPRWWKEKETRRCRDKRDRTSRAPPVFSSVADWLVGANKLLQAWSGRIHESDGDQECVHKHLIRVLDFSVEADAVAVKMASLRAADWPRAQVSELEVDRSRVTSALSKLQEQLQRRLLDQWPPVKLLPGLQGWFQGLETRLIHEKETVSKAENAAQLTDVLQNYQGLKGAMTKAQTLLDFLCQTGPQLVREDAETISDQKTVFAEQMGELGRHCQLLLTDVRTQIDDAQHMHRKCTKREERLEQLRGWTEEQKHRLGRRKEPISQTQAQRSLLELEELSDRVDEVGTTLRAMDVTVGPTLDLTFSAQADAVRHVCEDLSKETGTLRAALQQVLELWGCFSGGLREASLLTSRLQCSLRKQPLFSLKQTEGHLDFLQLLEEQSRNVEELWASVGSSYQRLEKTLHRDSAQLLRGQMDEELRRWKDVVEELKAEQMQTEHTLSLWKEFRHLSDRCSLLLLDLRHQWEQVCRASPQPDPPRPVDSVQKLQEMADDLQSMMGNVYAASEPLTKQLEPVAANWIKLELQHLSRDVLLLDRATSRTKEKLKEEREQQQLVQTRLDHIEEQIRSLQTAPENSFRDTNLSKVLPELSAAFAPLVDVSHRGSHAPLYRACTDRMHLLYTHWAGSMIHVFEVNRVLLHELLQPQSFPELSQRLKSVQKRLQEESNSMKPPCCFGLEDTLTVLQTLWAQIMMGQQHLHALLCHVVQSSEEAPEEETSELVAQATRMKRSWFASVAQLDQLRSVRDQLSRWRIYRSGLKLIGGLLGDVDCVLPPAGALMITTDDYQCVEDTLAGHSAAYSKTLEAGRHLYESVKDLELQNRLQTELQDLEKAWNETQSRLDRGRDLVKARVQEWSQSQNSISSLLSELEELETALKRPGSGPRCEEENHLQESELALRRLAGGLRELSGVKTDPGLYAAAGDAALLEQQLEQLHGRWEELCTKVSLRRQEIADRLNAWTIFNDKNKQFCDWLTQMEDKVSHRGDLSIEEMVEKLKKDCMEEINLFSENKSHLKQLGEQLLLASDAAKQTQVRGSLLEVNQRWHNLFHHIEARVKKLKETLATVQQLDKNMSNLRSWLSRVEAELSRPITYSVCHPQEIQRRLAEQQELQRDIQQHTEGVESVLSLCDMLLRDEDAAGATELEGDSLQETSRSLDQRWRTICTLALDRRLRIEETWRLWCKFLDDYSQFEDWLKTTERTAANPNSADVLYTAAKEELKKFEGFQRQVHERLTHLELVNNQYRRLARENRTDRASQLKLMVHEGNRRWDRLHRRVAAIVRRLKHFTSQREEFEGTRENMLVWLTELDLQLTNVEHFSESDVHNKIQQLNSFQKEITLNTERIDGLIVFGEGLIQKSSPQDAALIEEELEELHTYCQEVFGRLVRFHQRLSQPPRTIEEPDLSRTAWSLETNLELICRPWLGRSFRSLPATPTHLLASPLERSGRETPLSVDSLPLEWDHTGDVGGSSSHEDEEEEEEEDEEEERAHFSALSASSTSMTLHDPPTWQPQSLAPEECAESSPTLTSTPLGLVRDVQRYALILNDDGEQPEETAPPGRASAGHSGGNGCWELLHAQSGSQEHLKRDLDEITSWLRSTVPELEMMQRSDRAVDLEDLRARAKELREMQQLFSQHKPIVLRLNQLAPEAPELQDGLDAVNRDWSRARSFLQQWDASLRKTLTNCQEFHESLHSLLLWLDHAECRSRPASLSQPNTPLGALQQHRDTLIDLREELRRRRAQQASLQLLWSQLQPEEAAEDSRETPEKLRATGSKLKLLLRQVEGDLGALQQRLVGAETQIQKVALCPQDWKPEQSSSADVCPEEASSTRREKGRSEERGPSPPPALLYRVLRAALPLHLLLLLLLLLPCLIPVSESNPGCAGTNNFARSFYPMLHYTNGPPPT